LRSTHSDSTPAIVLGRGYTGLGAMRSLGQAGIPAWIACPASDLATRSRSYRALPGTSPWDGTIDDSAHERLRALPFEQAVLIPGADDAALWTADIAGSALSTRFRSSSSSRATLEILQDKDRFAAYLAGTDIPHPRTFAIADRIDIAAVDFRQLDRVFLKPVDSQRYNREFGGKGVWVGGRAELEAQWSRLDALGFQMVAQEYVPGGADDHYFVDGFRDRTGALAGIFCRRRLRIHPPDFGNSSYCASVPPGDLSKAIDSLGTLLAQLSYRGIFSAEFKRDARDGQFRLLEVNTRAWWYVEFAARCGVNVCRMAWEDANGLPVGRATDGYRVGAGCVNLHGDIQAVMSRRATDPAALPRALAQWARAYFHVFRLRDPWPGLSLLWDGIRQRIRKATSRPAASRSAKAG
jgi:predicted ATP-grasp superfamily ATP-dependent carboligase